MSRLHKIRLKSDAFIAQMNIHIAYSVSKVEKKLVAMNKKQLMSHKDSDGRALMHKGTNSIYLSPSYAKKKKKTRPNLFDVGNFQRGMFLEVNENNLTFFLGSNDYKTGILVKNYGKNIFGIGDKAKAKQLTGKEFKRLYIMKVWK